jgi:putative ABC transport system ATP-binding protein
MTQTVLTAANITHTYELGPHQVTVLHDINIEIRAGEVLLLAGPSGSGKTTLLQILGCLLKPTSGQVIVCGERASGRDSEALAALRLRYFGFVFQAYNLFPVLTATENVMVALDLLGVGKQQAMERARALLIKVGLGERLDSYPSQLSGGQRQRVAIARSMAAGPPILMADEPTAALDAESGQKAMRLFCALAKQNHAVVIVTHDPRIFHLADRIIHLEDGRITRCETAPRRWPHEKESAG